MIDRVILACHDFVASRPLKVLVGAALVLGAAAPVLVLRSTLDMSFRPLFAHAPELTAATDSFEARFGQSSGAQVAVLVERGLPLDVGFLRELARLTERLAQVPYVVEVLSPTSAAVAEWDGAGARGRLLVDPATLAASDAAAAAYVEALRAQGAAVGLAQEGRTALLLARIALPLDDLAGRRRVLANLKDAANEWRAGQDGDRGFEAGARLPVRVRFTGVSVVEAAYADAIPRGMALSLVLTTSAIVLLLALMFHHFGPVLVCMAGVAVATPVTLALFALSGRPITMLTSMAPTVILIVGVADAIHMLRRWELERARGAAGGEAVRRMMAAMALPCLLTSVTTALGFLALTVARVTAIRQFGVCAAGGTVVVYLANLALVPALLHLVGERLPRRTSGRPGRVFAPLAQLVTSRPGAVLAAATCVAIAGVLGIPRMRVDQRFNEELRPSHAAVRAQRLLEQEFGGFLGPDIEIRRRGAPVLDAGGARGVEGLAAELATVPGVAGVLSPVSFGAPAEAAPEDMRRGLALLRDDVHLRYRAREVVDASGGVALRVQTGDIGTRAALALADTIGAVAARRLGPEHEVRIAGQWWLAQQGMASLLRDMLASFGTSALLVLPILALALGSGRLLLVGLPPNLLPMLIALGVLGWSGIALRVGTALVLAVALAIAVDDTIHLLVRAHEERKRGAHPRAAMQAALVDTGPALTITTLVLIAGFLSMLASDIAAIRHMGTVAAAALGSALLADLLVAPALYVLLGDGVRLRNREAAPASSVGSSAGARSAKLIARPGHSVAAS